MRDSLGREVGYWRENYECQHCHKRVVIRLYATWPEQCPHCRVWHPMLAVQSHEDATPLSETGA